MNNGQGEPIPGSTVQIDITTVGSEAISQEPNVVGMIFGDVGTNSFKFAVTGSIERSDYVIAEHPDCDKVLCQIGSIIRKTTMTLEKALEANPNDPAKDKVIATTDVIGYKDEKGLLQVPRTTFLAGTPVRRADPEFIRRILGLKDDRKSCAYIGQLKGYDMPMMLDINSLVQRHVSILAKTGGGKSYISGDILEELMKHGVTCVIVDPHGEYGAMRDAAECGDEKFGVEPHGYSENIIEFGMTQNDDVIPLKFTFKSLDSRDLLDLLPSSDSKGSLSLLTKAMDSVKERKPLYSVRDVIDELSSSETGKAYSLIADLESIDALGLFAERGNHISELIQKGKTTIFNLKGVAPDIQQIIVRRLGTMMFELRKADKVPPMMMVLEEAHNYCPQNEGTLCKKILTTIASEGRKFGLGLMVISQRPAKIDKNVLSQCGTQIILKVTNPNDLKAIAASIEGLTGGMEQDIPGLPIGTAMVVGAGIQTPMLVDVRPRESRHGGASVQILENDDDE